MKYTDFSVDENCDLEPMHTIPDVPDLSKCYTLCDKHENCRVVNYNNDTKQCMLYAQRACNLKSGTIQVYRFPKQKTGIAAALDPGEHVTSKFAFKDLYVNVYKKTKDPNVSKKIAEEAVKLDGGQKEYIEYRLDGGNKPIRSIHTTPFVEYISKDKILDRAFKEMLNSIHDIITTSDPYGRNMELINYNIVTEEFFRYRTTIISKLPSNTRKENVKRFLIEKLSEENLSDEDIIRSVKLILKSLFIKKSNS